MGEKDYTIDSFYSIDLNKADGVIAYWENLSDVEKAKQFAAQGSEEEDEEESGDEEEDEDAEFGNEVLVAEEEDFEEDEMQEEEEGEEMEIPDPRPWLPHPKAFESLRTFYIRTGPQFLEWAISNNRDAKGKHLKKNSFDLCQDRWWERRDQVRFEEDKLEEMGGVGDVIEKDLAQKTKRR